MTSTIDQLISLKTVNTFEKITKKFDFKSLGLLIILFGADNIKKIINEKITKFSEYYNKPKEVDFSEYIKNQDVNHIDYDSVGGVFYSSLFEFIYNKPELFKNKGFEIKFKKENINLTNKSFNVLDLKDKLSHLNIKYKNYTVCILNNINFGYKLIDKQILYSSFELEKNTHDFENVELVKKLLFEVLCLTEKDIETMLSTNCFEKKTNEYLDVFKLMIGSRVFIDEKMYLHIIKDVDNRSVFINELENNKEMNDRVNCISGLDKYTSAPFISHKNTIKIKSKIYSSLNINVKINYKNLVEFFKIIAMIKPNKDESNSLSVNLKEFDIEVEKEKAIEIFKDFLNDFNSVIINDDNQTENDISINDIEIKRKSIYEKIYRNENKKNKNKNNNDNDNNNNNVNSGQNNKKEEEKEEKESKNDECENFKINIVQLNSIFKSFDTLYLKEKEINTLKNVLYNFKSHKDLYKELGIQYKFNVLLYGPPGCGKTSTIFTIASYLQRNIYYLNLNSIKTNTELKRILAHINESIGKNGIVVMEDIDAMTDLVLQRKENFPEQKKYRKNKYGYGFEEDDDDKLTLECLLNLLQGSLTQNGSIFIVTTNYIDKLDSAFVREGRFDLKINLNECDHYQMKNIYKKFFNIETDLLKKIPEYTITPSKFIYSLLPNLLNKNMTDYERLSPFIEEENKEENEQEIFTKIN